MKFTLIHPSRERAIKAHATATRWIMAASGDHEIEYILSIDADDAQKEEYHERFNGIATAILVGRNRSLVDAVNNAAERATGELLIVVSDDFDCPDNWDEGLYDITIVSHRSDYAIHVDDCYSYPKELLTIPILTRSLYQRLGYIYHPDYFSMFADNDLYEVCKKLDCLIDAGHLKFPHNHFANGKSPEDHTYRRQNSAMAWQIGERALEARRKRNFDLA